MPNSTNNLNLTVYDSVSDVGVFMTEFVDKTVGQGQDSNMVKIDNAIGDLNSLETQDKGSIVEAINYVSQNGGGVSVSSTAPTDGNVYVWINPDENESYTVADINDNIISTEDTWSSSKISEAIAAGGGGEGTVTSVNGVLPDSSGNVELTYDTSINNTSTNAVQNQAISVALDGKGNIGIDLSESTEVGVPVKDRVETITINGKNITSNPILTANDIPIVLTNSTPAVVSDTSSEATPSAQADTNTTVQNAIQDLKDNSFNGVYNNLTGKPFYAINNQKQIFRTHFNQDDIDTTTCTNLYILNGFGNSATGSYCDTIIGSSNSIVSSVTISESGGTSHHSYQNILGGSKNKIDTSAEAGYCATCIITGDSNTITSGNNNFIDGNGNTLQNGSNNIVSGQNNTLQNGSNNIVSGQNNTSGQYGRESIVCGIGNNSNNTSSIVAGQHNIVSEAWSAIVAGQWNNENRLDNRITIGNGTDAGRSNAFRVISAGNVYGGPYASSGADYAEMFEWLDGNPDNEDRRGLFVTLDGDKIRLANPDEDYILGIVSGYPSVCGDVYDDQWNGMYEKDVFGAYIKDEKSENGLKLNPNYDNSQTYIPRSERKEWAYVGLVGKLVVVDDGTCIINNYCSPSNNGIATHSKGKTSYRVMRRIDENHIQVIVK